MSIAGASVYQTVLDLEPRRLTAVVGAWPEPALLTGGPGFGAAGRWSILAARPRLTFEATGDSWALALPGQIERGKGDVLNKLGALLRRWELADPREAFDPSLPPFQGGLIGFLGYDLAPLLERLPRKASPDSSLPDARFGLYDTAVLIDHESRTATLWAHDLLGEGALQTRRRLRRWARALERAAKRGACPDHSRLGAPRSNFTRPEYVGAVRRALDYIAAGDVFQVNVSQRFTAEGSVVPLDLFLRLQARSPAPFGAFLQWGERAVASASPEWFFQTRGDWIATRPIKGTRPRHSDPAEDARLAAALCASSKDRAELVMIVDLERNDLGRVCQYGTVRVTEPGAIESFAQVHHRVATIEGRLRPDIEPVDILRAVFPGGSITGAPKIRAMQIIDELEPTRRSLYTGAIGYFSRGGSSGFNIAIRTLLMEPGRASVQAGGGIVADSDPESEYEETLHKARALLEVLQEPGDARCSG